MKKTNKQSMSGKTEECWIPGAFKHVYSPVASSESDTSVLFCCKPSVVKKNNLVLCKVQAIFIKPEIIYYDKSHFYETWIELANSFKTIEGKWMDRWVTRTMT